MEQSTVETWRRPCGAWAWEPRERDNIAVVAIIFTTCFPCRYRQRARLRRQAETGNAYTPARAGKPTRRLIKRPTAKTWLRPLGALSRAWHRWLNKLLSWICVCNSALITITYRHKDGHWRSMVMAYKVKWPPGLKTFHSMHILPWETLVPKEVFITFM